MSNIIVSKAHKQILVPDTPGVRTMFPDAPQLPGGNKIIIPHGMRETLMLRHLGVPAPNPIDYHYDYAGAALRGKPPFKVQKLTARMLTENSHAYVLNDMGTGKTKTALWAWNFLFKQGLVKKLLVVAPLSTLHFVWAREVFDTLPGTKVQVLHAPTKAQRLDKLAQDADIYIINHDGVKVIGDYLVGRPDIDALLIDELAVYRNDNPRSRYMRKFAQRFQVVWGMTGSPMPNDPTDVWSQCTIVNPGRVPKFKSHAKEELMTRSTFNMYDWKPKPDAVEKAFNWMQPSCRYKLADVTELPPVTYRDIDVKLSAEQAQTYKEVAKAMVAMVRGRQITAMNAGVAMGKLLQISGGWVYTTNPDFVRLDPTPRVAALVDTISSTNRKVLVAVPYRHMMEGLSKIMSMKGVDIDHCMVHGDTKKKEDLFYQFQETPKFKVMLADPRCVHHGLTLTAADTILWYLPMASLSIYEQFNARITRIGQGHKQQVLHLCSTPTERHIYKILQDKEDIQDKFLELIENSMEDEL